MKRGKLITAMLMLLSSFELTLAEAVAQQPQEPAASFKASVDLVRLSAVVRDKKGRFVQNLTARDFEVLDGGQITADQRLPPRPVGRERGAAVRRQRQHGSALTPAREAATHVLSWLDARDEAAVFTFDSALDEVAPFTTGMQALPPRLSRSTRSAPRRSTTRSRRPPNAWRPGEGTAARSWCSPTAATHASQLTPSEVSAIASAIDVPVYIVGIVPGDRQPVRGHRYALLQSGQRCRVAGRPGALDRRRNVRGQHDLRTSSIVARQIVDELRHQYLIAFESSGTPGWHPLVVRARDKDLHRTSPERLYRGAISPDFAARRIDHVPETRDCCFRSRRWSLGGSTACATKKFVRTSVGEVNDEGRLARPLRRRDAGAHAPERRAHLRGRPEGRRPPRSRRSAAQHRRRGREHGNGDGSRGEGRHGQREGRASTRRSSGWSTKSC